MQSANSHIEILPKTNTDGHRIKLCWKTTEGYSIAECRLENKIVYHITAPKGTHPFAYTPLKSEVRKIIFTDMASRNG